MATIRLRKGNVQPVWSGHPWVFAQAIDRVEGAPGPGDVVRVLDPEGRFLGAGFWSPESAIPIRLLTRNAGDSLDEAGLAKRIERAVQFRKGTLRLPNDANTGYRLVHAEGDDLAGLIVDIYGDVAVVQVLTIGMHRHQDALYAHIQRLTGARTILQAASEPRSEGFRNETEVVRGPDPTELRFRERGFDLQLPIGLTQKTGYYFDQRDNRARVEAWASGRVLDAYSYVGAMGLSAARGGADEVLCVDSSAPVTAAGSTLAHHNQLGDRITFQRADLKRLLPTMVARSERFDMVILDPPKLASSRRHLDKARRAYTRVNELAARIVRNGGMLVTCSCSAAMRPSDFVRSVNRGIRQAKRHATLVTYGTQGPDHPTPAAFPEGRYLKALFLRIDE